MTWLQNTEEQIQVQKQQQKMWQSLHSQAGCGDRLSPRTVSSGKRVSDAVIHMKQQSPHWGSSRPWQLPFCLWLVGSKATNSSLLHNVLEHGKGSEVPVKHLETDLKKYASILSLSELMRVYLQTLTLGPTAQCIRHSLLNLSDHVFLTKSFTSEMISQQYARNKNTGCSF